MERIQRSGTVAVLVDVQERLFPHIHKHERLENNLLRLLQGLQILQLPLLVTQQYTRGLGPTIPALQAFVKEPALEKMHFSCCGSTAFRAAIGEAGTVVLCGIEAHVCVLQTALDLLATGKRVVWVDDCIGSRKPHDKAIALQRLLRQDVIPTTCESLLLELCEISGTDEFRAISKLIK